MVFLMETFKKSSLKRHEIVYIFLTNLKHRIQAQCRILCSQEANLEGSQVQSNSQLHNKFETLSQINPNQTITATAASSPSLLWLHFGALTWPSPVPFVETCLQFTLDVLTLFCCVMLYAFVFWGATTQLPSKSHMDTYYQL